MIYKIDSTEEERVNAHKEMIKIWKGYSKKYNVLDAIPAQLWADAFEYGYRCRLKQENNKKETRHD